MKEKIICDRKILLLIIVLYLIQFFLDTILNPKQLFKHIEQ